MNIEFTETKQPIITVSQLNNLARQVLEDSFDMAWVEGEISNFIRASSGHSYFTLKDQNAQVRCAMFKHRNMALSFKPENGLHVIVRAKVSLYEGRGDFQLIVDQMEEAGDGVLQRAFEALKKRLSEEGLFAEDHKVPIPALPKCIGIITSPTGAAVKDILTTLRRRFPAIPVIIYPTLVQGAEAASQIVNAIKNANHHKQCDVLILSRGGGSLEDLWPFNEEIVARAIYSCDIPIVSGVGHEIDITIADFVADKRAATPTAAAELVTPHQEEWINEFDYFYHRLIEKMEQQIKHLYLIIDSLRKQLRHPGDRLREYAQSLDHFEHRLRSAINNKIQNCQQYLQSLSRALNNISPLNTLSRGYSITQKGNKIITTTQSVAIGDSISVRLHSGKLDCNITNIEEIN